MSVIIGSANTFDHLAPEAVVGDMGYPAARRARLIWV